MLFAKEKSKHNAGEYCSVGETEDADGGMID